MCIDAAYKKHRGKILSRGTENGLGTLNTKTCKIAEQKFVAKTKPQQMKKFYTTNEYKRAVDVFIIATVDFIKNYYNNVKFLNKTELTRILLLNLNSALVPLHLFTNKVINRFYAQSVQRLSISV